MTNSPDACSADIVERLRRNETLPVCPFDSLSPHYLTTPDDKPCPICGQENTLEGPDKCRGADTRIMKEAAAVIERLRGDVRAYEITIKRIAEEDSRAPAQRSFACKTCGALYSHESGCSHLPCSAGNVEVPTDALINLVNYQEQCDEDGVMVKVSRQALAEVLVYVQLVRPDLNGDEPQEVPDRQKVIDLIGYHFAALLSGNNQPHMSGDPRARLVPHVRRRFDDACETTADAILALSRPHLAPERKPQKVCLYSDGCPVDGPVCHLCAHVQP